MRTLTLGSWIAVSALFFISCSDSDPTPAPTLSIGSAAIPITPCGTNDDWDGPVTAAGIWGEAFDDANANGRYDPGESFTDDPRNNEVEPGSAGKWDGIYLAGFGNDRPAKGCADDIWVRTLVVDDGETRIAFTSLDIVGALEHGAWSGFAHARALLDPGVGIDTFIWSSTHSHQGPDTIGLWGTDTTVDGKFPLYLQFIDRQVAKAIEVAVGDLRPVARVRAMHVGPEEDPALRGLQVRTRCRPPFIFDDELRALAFEDASGETLATLLNWSTHPESLESENELVSSDFVHYIRDEVESRVGGTSVYFSGDLGAAEIVGDSCVGGAPARNDDGSNEFDNRDDIGFPRTEEIGRAVGDAIVRGLAEADEVAVSSIDVRSKTYRFAASNLTFELGRQIGVLDLDPEIYDSAKCPGSDGLCGTVEQHAIVLNDGAGKAQVEIVTLPGEVFPELYLGVENHRRTDCPEADTGLPPEPSIRDAMSSEHRFVIGLSPDEIGYIVPAYDYQPANIFDEASDACDGQNWDPEYPRRTVPGHYHETLSIGVEGGAFVTCTAVELLAGPQAVADDPACADAR